MRHFAFFQLRKLLITGSLRSELEDETGLVIETVSFSNWASNVHKSDILLVWADFCYFDFCKHQCQCRVDVTDSQHRCTLCVFCVRSGQKHATNCARSLVSLDSTRPGCAQQVPNTLSVTFTPTMKVCLSIWLTTNWIVRTACTSPTR